MITVEIERKQLEMMRYAVQMSLDDRLMMDAISAEVYHDAAHRMICTLTYDVYGEKREPRRVQWPATWWDAFKQRWFPKWWLRRWPVRYAFAEFRCTQLYPDVRGMGRIFEYVEMSNPDNWLSLPPKAER